MLRVDPVDADAIVVAPGNELGIRGNPHTSLIGRGGAGVSPKAVGVSGRRGYSSSWPLQSLNLPGQAARGN
jgi:hypothetical protein